MPPAASGMDNHGIRYYDPEVGRYLTRDPIGYGDGMNVYLYVHGNPVSHIDPLGLAETLANWEESQSGNDSPSRVTYTPTSREEKNYVQNLSLPKPESDNHPDICVAPPPRGDAGPQFLSLSSVKKQQQALQFTQSLGGNSSDPKFAEDVAFDLLTARLGVAAGDVTSLALKQGSRLFGRKMGGIVATEFADPMAIRFSQPTVSQNFSTGQSLNDTANALRSGQLAATDLPTIRVVEQNGSLFTLDNRRLVVFQQAGLSEIPIHQVSLSETAIMKEFLRKYNPVNCGQNIVVTPKAAGRGAAEAVLREYGKIK